MCVISFSVKTFLNEPNKRENYVFVLKYMCNSLAPLLNDPINNGYQKLIQFG